MTTWQEFTTAAPRVSAIFAQRHQEADRLCLLGTLRADGYPRISPVEPCIFEGQLVIAGMPCTTKFRDLARDSRFTLHTTVTGSHGDGGGEAKLWGVAEQVDDHRLHRRFKQWVFDELGFDNRALAIDGSFFLADIEGGSAVETDGDGLKITVWKVGGPERLAEPGKA